MSSKSQADPLELLREDLNDSDNTLVMRGLRQVATVARAIGPSRTRDQLLPFLTAFAQADNDEAHCEIAKQLGEMVQLVGGPNTPHVSLLLPLLEKFAGEEETVIRDASLASIVKIAPSLSIQHRSSQLFPLIKRLAAGDWFPPRCTASPLIVGCYGILSAPEQKTLRTSYLQLCRKSETPMVRKSAFKNLGDFSVAVEGKHFLSELLPVIRLLAQNDLDSFRLYVADICAKVASALSSDETQTFVMPLVQQILTDRSWRVRSHLAERIADLAENIQDPKCVASSVLPIFSSLLTDRQADVRTAAVRALVRVAAQLPRSNELVEHIAPVLEPLSSDEEANVRRALSMALVPLCNSFPLSSNAKVLVPVMKIMVQDELPIVRHNVIAKMDMLKDTKSNDILNAMFDSLLHLSTDIKWRVRMGVIDKVALLAKTLGRNNYERKLQPLVLRSLIDHVSAIREAACKQSAQVAELFGASWAQDTFFPSAFTNYNVNTNYLHRMTCLQLIQSVATDTKITGNIYNNTFFPLLAQAFVDEVANVRLMACQTLLELIPHLSTQIISARVRPALQALTKDSDNDVSYFAHLCAEKLRP